MSKRKNALHRQEEIEELLGNPPSWLTRWGITVIVSVIAALLVGAYFFRYPEIISSPVVVTAEHPAIWLVAHTNGRIDSICVSDLSEVQQGQLIATLENTASATDVFLLKEELECFFNSFRRNCIDHTWVLTRNLYVGELNDCYNRLLQSVDDYLLFRKEKLHELRIEALLNEKQRKINYLTDLERQCRSYGDYSSIVKKQYLRDSSLYVKGAVPLIQLESTHKELISSEVQLNQSLSSLSAVQLEIHTAEQNISEMKIDYREKEKTYYNNLNAAYELLYNRIKEWEKKYILRSPSAGKISFLKYWSKNQYVHMDEKVFTIIPDNYGKILGRCHVKTSGMGKLKKGQQVIIKLDEYPYMEYGMLKGFVANISLIGMETGRTEDQSRYAVVEIAFDKNDLISTYNTPVDFKGELTGIAEIATKEMSLLEHFINPLKYLWSNVE